MSPLITRRTLLRGIAVTSIGITASGQSARAADKPSTIRIGSTAPGHLKFILARHSGAFEKEFAEDGISIEQVLFTNGGSEATTALATGAIEVTYTGNNPALRVAASGADVKCVGLSSFAKADSTTIIVRVDSTYKSVADLKGKKVAYLFGTVRHSIFSKALRSVNLTTGDVDSLNLAFDASGPALARGDVDAIVESGDTSAKLVEAGQARVLLDANDHPEWAAPYIISVNGDFAHQYPEIVTRLLKVDIALARWADAHPEETIKIFADETKSSERSVHNTYRDGQFYQDPRITDAAVVALRSEEKFMIEAKLLKGAVDYDKWIDRTYLDAAYKLADAS